MGQAFGIFAGDGTVDQGSGNFSVQRQSAGNYLVTLNDTSNTPVVVVSVMSAYVTANAVISQDGASGSNTFGIRTGFTDQQGNMDVDWVHFIAQY